MPRIGVLRLLRLIFNSRLWGHRYELPKNYPHRAVSFLTVLPLRMQVISILLLDLRGHLPSNLADL